VNRARRKGAIQVLNELLSPVTASTFWSDYWERQPLHVVRELPVWCSELPSIDDLDAIISLMPPSGAEAEGLRLVRAVAGRVEDSSIARGPDGRPDVPAVYRAYAQGWTVVVNRLHLRSAPVARLAAAVADETGYGIGVNLYCSPARSRGFPAHADGHDALLLQMDGRKTWQVYPPQYDLPLEDSDVEIKPTELGEPLLQATLARGHLLYVPRGFIHAGATESELSMHLTLGIHPTRWLDLLLAALRVAADHSLDFRRTIPAAELHNPATRAQIGIELERLFQSISGGDVAAHAVERVLSLPPHLTPQAFDRHFRAVERSGDVRGATMIARRPGLRTRVVREENRACIVFGAHRLRAPLFVAPALDFISSRSSFRVDELPEVLSGSSKITLIRRLIQEGLLTIAEDGDRTNHHFGAVRESTDRPRQP